MIVLPVQVALACPAVWTCLSHLCFLWFTAFTGRGPCWQRSFQAGGPRMKSIEQQAPRIAAVQRQRQRQASPATSGPAPLTSAGASAASLRRVPLDDSTSHPRSTSAAEDNLWDVCVVCMDACKDWVCIPCRHLAMCGLCIERVKRVSGRCPICKQPIKKIMQIYRV